MPEFFRDGDATKLPDDGRIESNNTPFSFCNALEHAGFANNGTPYTNKNTETLTETQKKVAVILGYYNGEIHISEQLKSIFEQSHQALHVFVSDDQSLTPFSIDGLNLDIEYLAKLSIGYRPDNVGFANNFLNALARIDDSFEYFAFSDQDDIWYENKLEKAIKALSAFSSDIPALYCARTEIVDATCEKTLGYSHIFSKPPSFANALIQSIGGGNTMVFNKAAKDIIVASKVKATVISHDWWCYQIVTGAGGHVVYDTEPCLKYRQHNSNLIGQNTRWRDRLLRIRVMLQGHFRTWNNTNLKALADHKHLLTNANLRVLNEVMEARQSNLFKRLILFKRSGIYRQTLLGNLGLLFAILFNKV